MMQTLVSSVTITAHQQALHENVRTWVLNRPQLFWTDNDVTASFGGAHRRKGHGVKSVDDDGLAYDGDSRWRVFSADPYEDDEDSDDKEDRSDGEQREVKQDKEEDPETKAKRETRGRYFLYVERGDAGRNKDIVIFYMGRSDEPIRKLLRKLHKPIMKRGAVNIHVPTVPQNNDGTFNTDGVWVWQYSKSIPRRSVESIYLDPELKASIMEDVERYLEPSTQA